MKSSGVSRKKSVVTGETKGLPAPSNILTWHNAHLAEHHSLLKREWSGDISPWNEILSIQIPRSLSLGTAQILGFEKSGGSFDVGRAGSMAF